MASESTPIDLRGGTAQSGYHLTLVPAEWLLHTRVHGAWETTLGYEYDRDMRKLMELCKGQRWVMLGDLRNSAIQNVEVAKIRTELIKLAHELKVSRMAFLVDKDNPLPKMQMRRMALAAQCECDFFTEEAPARSWLASEKAGFNAASAAAD